VAQMAFRLQGIQAGTGPRTGLGIFVRTSQTLDFRHNFYSASATVRIAEQHILLSKDADLCQDPYAYTATLTAVATH